MLRYLLNFWFSTIFGIFFAAGAVADLGGGGDAGSGGDAGGSSDAGSLPDSGDDQSGGTDADSRQDGDVSGSPDDSSGSDPNALIDSGDGRKIPQKYAELFKNDKGLKELYFSGQALKRSFPGGVKEAVEFKRSVEDLGGIDGIEQLKSDLAIHTQDAEQFLNDPAKWAESGFQENPETALKAFSHSLDYVAEHHSEQYDHLMAKVIVNDLDQNFPLREIHGVLAGLKDNADAQMLAKKIAAYYNSRYETSRKVPEKQVSAQEKALADKAEKLTQQEQQIRNKTINTEAAPYMTKAIETNLEQVAKGSGFDLAKLKKDQPNRYGRFVKDVRTAVHQNVLADSKWLDRYSQALQGGDTAKCVRMLNARHDQAINGNGRDAGVVSGIFAEWFGAPKAGAKPAADKGTKPVSSAGGGANATLRVNAMPPKNEIVWNHPKTRIIDQVAMRKDGKLVTWAG